MIGLYFLASISYVTSNKFCFVSSATPTIIFLFPVTFLHRALKYQFKEFTLSKISLPFSFKRSILSERSGIPVVS